MLRFAWLLIPLSLAACGGKASVETLSVTCDGGTQLYGALSIDVPGDLVNGRPSLTFPDPANPEEDRPDGSAGGGPLQDHAAKEQRLTAGTQREGSRRFSGHGGAAPAAG